MPVFEYTGTTRGGERAKGTVAAPSAVEGRRQLSREGVQLLAFRPARIGKERTRRSLPLAGRGSKVRRRDEVAQFARQLALLLRSGVALAPAVELLAGQSRGAFSAALKDVVDAVRDGADFHTAVERHPDYFGVVFRASVRIGEATGNMDVALGDLADYLLKHQSRVAKLGSALLYPAILGTVCIAVVLFLTTFVIPQVLPVLEASGRPMPTSTRFLMRFSDFCKQNWLLVGLATVVLASAITFALRHARVRPAMEQLVLRIPRLGDLLTKACVSSFAQTMTLLLRSGVPFLQALSIVRGATRSVLVRRELERIETRTNEGGDMGAVALQSTILPPLLAHLLAIGQESGELPETLQTIRDGYDAEVEIAIQRFAAMIEPVLIVAMSVVVGFVVFATMRPILDVTTSIR